MKKDITIFVSNIVILFGVVGIILNVAPVYKLSLIHI